MRALTGIVPSLEYSSTIEESELNEQLRLFEEQFEYSSTIEESEPNLAY